MIIFNLIYILQGENYDNKRFLRFVYRNLKWHKLSKRNKLVITKKSSAVLALTFLLLTLLVSIIFFLKFTLILVAFYLTLLYFVLPLIIVFSAILIYPLDLFLKKRKIEKAREILQNCEKLKVLGITGSFGKTSLKNILADILKEKFFVVKTAGNINTDIGIADFIIQNAKLLKKAEIFIVEMGAYKRGEIEKIAKMVGVDYSFLTNIGTAHLERFGSMENIIKTKFELAQNTGKEIFLNADNKYILNYYQKYKEVVFGDSSFILKKVKLITTKNVQEIKRLKNFQGLKFKYKNNIFETKLLAKHNIILFLLAVEFAKELGIKIDNIQKAIQDIKPIKHRLQPIFNPNTRVWVIDDSYNGNYQGFLSGVDVVKDYQGRKIVLSPGIVEQGEKIKEIHKKIGKVYAKNLDLVLLIDNSAIKFIIDGMKEEHFENFKVYKTAMEAHKDLPNILRPGDVILFQNDLSDNYY